MNQNQDLEHIKLLSIFHYVLGGLVGLFAFFPVIHLVVGIFILTGAFDGGHGEPPPRFVGLMFVIMASVFILGGWALASCLLVAAGSLRKCRRYMFCFITACVSCIVMPLGTVLGIFTILVLSRPGAKALFGRGNASPAQAPAAPGVQPPPPPGVS
ncbi:MAG: hypothetical protein ACYS8X_13000 [Planctomycetota bacterium]|jgi:hypothetical protein